MASSQTDIIDLTVESPPVTQLPQDSEPEPESGEIDVKEPKLESETRKSRKRKKKRKSITADTAESRKQPRDDATDRGEGPSRTRESPSKRSKRSPTPTADDGDFYVDLTPALQSTSSQRAVPAFSTSELPPDEETKLILPSHVQVFGSLPVEIIPASQENEDFIDYLDYDSNSRKGIARYYQDPDEKPVKTKSVCKNCGAEGEHTTFHCPVIICLTCGARDEHTTRSCPISKNCFTCGMKGHLSSSCPNRHTYQRGSSSYLCQRCGNETHLTSECPTWWRLYEYISEEDRTKTINSRREKATLSLGEGGEGYIAEDAWCYNCGLGGHWGDSCDAARPIGVPEDGSAFHPRNILSGPFSETDIATNGVVRRDFRDWEKDDNFIGNAGRVGKQKARQRLERSERNQRETDDSGHSWFDNKHRRRETAPARSDSGKGPKKISFGASIGKQFIPLPPKPTGLESRLSDRPNKNGREDGRKEKEKRGERDSQIRICMTMVVKARGGTGTATGIQTDDIGESLMIIVRVTRVGMHVNVK
ncbi:hypothetical protein CPB85DRAFT_519191 [Mucidula mucida]|nr:hypothetical protein CPB85DRAFT_519191 [Mucidula mucida]